MALTQIKRNTVKIDAKGKSIGRLATEVAKILQGKHKPVYEAHNDHGDFVQVSHAAKVKITGNKLEDKTYFHYSGYPGGMRRTKLKDVMTKDASEALRRAVWNMLPKNRLRKDRLKRLSIKND